MKVSSLKVAELREELKKRNLPTKGLKAELVARLKEALNEEESADAEESVCENAGDSSFQAVQDQSLSESMTGSNDVPDSKVVGESETNASVSPTKVEAASGIMGSPDPPAVTTSDEQGTGEQHVGENVEVKAVEEKVEAKAVEENVEEKAVEENVEAKAVEENVEAKAVEENVEEKAVEENVEEKAVEENVEENVEKKAAEENVEEKAVEENVEENIEKKAAEENVEEKAAEENVEEKAVEENVEEKAAADNVEAKAVEELSDDVNQTTTGTSASEHFAINDEPMVAEDEAQSARSGDAANAASVKGGAKEPVDVADASASEIKPTIEEPVKRKCVTDDSANDCAEVPCSETINPGDGNSSREKPKSDEPTVDNKTTTQVESAEGEKLQESGKDPVSDSKVTSGESVDSAGRKRHRSRSRSPQRRKRLRSGDSSKRLSRSRSHSRESSRHSRKEDSTKDDGDKGEGERTSRHHHRRRSRSPRRHRSRSRSRSRSRRSPVDRDDDATLCKEPTEWESSDRVFLDHYHCDLHLKVAADGLSAEPISDEGFAFCWAGVRANHGLSGSECRKRVWYEVKVTRKVKDVCLPSQEPDSYAMRIGWIAEDSLDYQLGDAANSYGFESTGKRCSNCQFAPYGASFGVGDVVTCFADCTDPNVTRLSYAVNGHYLGLAFAPPKQNLYPCVLTKNFAFAVHFSDKTGALWCPPGCEPVGEAPIPAKEEAKTDAQPNESMLDAAQSELPSGDKPNDQEQECKETVADTNVEDPSKDTDAGEKAVAAEENLPTSDTKQDPAEEAEGNPIADSEKMFSHKQEMPVTSAEDKTKKQSQALEPLPEYDFPSETCEWRTIQQLRDSEDDAVCVVRGALPPAATSDCEVILMVGLPGSGKTHWVRDHLEANPHKRFTILASYAVLEKMSVAGKSRREITDAHRWSVFPNRAAACVTTLCKLAALRRRNYIIDLTNVLSAGQKQKIRPFSGFKKIAVCVVPDSEELKRRRSMPRVKEVGKEVDDADLLEMKAEFSVPSSDSFDQLIFPALPEEEARKMVVDDYNKAAGSRRQGDSGSRRSRFDDDRDRDRRRHDDRRRDRRDDRSFRGGFRDGRSRGFAGNFRGGRDYRDDRRDFGGFRGRSGFGNRDERSGQSFGRGPIGRLGPSGFDRVDRDRGERSSRFDRGDRSFERGDRGFDGGDRVDRSFDRSNRSFDRAGRGYDRSDRNDRGFNRNDRGLDRGDQGLDRMDRGIASGSRFERGGIGFDRNPRGFDRGGLLQPAIGGHSRLDSESIRQTDRSVTGFRDASKTTSFRDDRSAGSSYRENIGAAFRQTEDRSSSFRSSFNQRDERDLRQAPERSRGQSRFSAAQQDVQSVPPLVPPPISLTGSFQQQQQPTQPLSLAPTGGAGFFAGAQQARQNPVGAFNTQQPQQQQQQAAFYNPTQQWGNYGGRS